MTNSYVSQLIQGSDPTEKKTLAKRSEFSLIRADKILMLSFMTLDMHPVMMSDEKGMLCLAMLPFMSLTKDLIMMSDKKEGLYLVW